MRFILDTNVVVSALISRVETAPPRFLLEALADARFESLVSHELVLEWREVAQRPKLRRYFRLDADGIEFALSRIEQLSDKIDPPPAAVLAPDPADAHLWAILAADPTAVLVTGDPTIPRFARKQPMADLTPPVLRDRPPDARGPAPR